MGGRGGGGVDRRRERERERQEERELRRKGRAKGERMVHPKSWIVCAQEKSAKLRKEGRQESKFVPQGPFESKSSRPPQTRLDPIPPSCNPCGAACISSLQTPPSCRCSAGPDPGIRPAETVAASSSSTPVAAGGPAKTAQKIKQACNQKKFVWELTTGVATEADLNPAFQHFRRGEWNSLLKFNRPIELGLRRGGRRRPWRALGLETWRTTGHRACLASLGRVFVEVACPLPF